MDWVGPDGAAHSILVVAVGTLLSNSGPQASHELVVALALGGDSVGCGLQGMGTTSSAVEGTPPPDGGGKEGEVGGILKRARRHSTSPLSGA